ncbi:hypothetical protein XENTR_v10014320 [Xenopus tropicalis]|nr:hypothetical protein XENTR_v10014320 [Xenopus tropicalis]
MRCSCSLDECETLICAQLSVTTKCRKCRNPQTDSDLGQTGLMEMDSKVIILQHYLDKSISKMTSQGTKIFRNIAAHSQLHLSLHKSMAAMPRSLETVLSFYLTY